jgi:hypothetical protein
MFGGTPTTDREAAIGGVLKMSILVVCAFADNQTLGH